MRTRRARGATLFEFAVSAAVWGLLAAVLLTQVRRYQGSAELTGVRYQVGLLRTALAGKAMEAHAQGQPERLRALAGSNPVTLLQSAPPNYAGEVDDAARAAIQPGHWYFDRKQQILVYLFTGNKSFSGGNPKVWSFRVECTCLPTNNAKPPGTSNTDIGVALHQVDG